MPTIAAEPLGLVGARVEGADAERLLGDDDLPAWCLARLAEHGVLVFPGIDLDDEALVAFTHRLGPPVLFGVRADLPELWPVTLDRAKNPRPDYIYGSIAWHIDGTVDGIPARATLLTPRVLSEGGDSTEFASTYVAYDELSAEEQARFEELRVVHNKAGTQRAIHPNPTPELVEELNGNMAPREHPLVWRHLDGRRSLVIGSSAVEVVGMPRDEGAALLDGLVERATAPGHVYRHEWEMGDLVMWDNCGTIHRAVPYDRTSPRTMHRTTLAGIEPIQ
jgi:alpha-ketoglutarate-dependent taurine dioxygenase